MTLFSKIIEGEIPSYKIAESDLFFAFLDIFPLVKGHVLIVSKKETDKFFDLPNDYLSSILLFLIDTSFSNFKFSNLLFSVSKLFDV